MPSPLRARGAVVPPVDQDWVGRCLAELGTMCEYGHCEEQAEFACENKHNVAYLCTGHFVAVEESPRKRADLNRRIWEKFLAQFNFITQIRAPGSTLLQDLEAREAQIKDSKEEAERNKKALVRDVVKALREQDTHIGSPDDELAVARGAQSPPGDDNQFIFRVSEPGMPDSVILPQRVEDPLVAIVLM